MQQYIVGGSVRDVLLGVEPKDIDYVWTGITPQYLVDMGFQQVGADFPVFLDKNGDQHALARIERKVGVGYNGFECVFDTSITIEDDLMRRDLTINSMAVRIEDWETFKITKCKELLVDPYNGFDDLRLGYLTHTSEAFAEDPVRVLRTARFAARYNFTISASTLELMKNIAPELNHVPTERIWAEFEKGLMEKHPLKMMKTLEQCAWEVDVLQPFLCFNEKALERCDDTIPLECRFVLIAYDFEAHDYGRLSIPNRCSKLNDLYHQVHQLIWNYKILESEDKLKLFTLTRSFNTDQNLELVFKVISVHTLFTKGRTDLDQIRNDLKKLRMIDLSELTKNVPNSKQIQEIIMNVRLQVLEQDKNK